MGVKDYIVKTPDIDTGPLGKLVHELDKTIDYLMKNPDDKDMKRFAEGLTVALGIFAFEEPEEVKRQMMVRYKNRTAGKRAAATRKANAEKKAAAKKPEPKKKLRKIRSPWAQSRSQPSIDRK